MPPRKTKTALIVPEINHKLLPAERHFVEKYTDVVDDGTPHYLCAIINQVLEQDDLIRFALGDQTRMRYTRIEVIAICSQLVKRSEYNWCVSCNLADELYRELNNDKSTFGYTEEERLDIKKQIESSRNTNKPFA